MPYVLIIDDEEDLREIIKLSVETVFAEEIVLAKSGNEAVSLVKAKGPPVACISDFRMADGGGEVVWEYFQKFHPAVPFRFCSGCDLEEIRQKVPAVTTYLAKPSIHDALLKFFEDEVLAKDSANGPTAQKYLPFRLSLLIRLGFVKSDLYLKLSESNYVKVFHVNSEFTPEDGLRFLKKNVVSLYILKTQAAQFVHDFEKSLALFLNEKKTTDPGAFSQFAVESIEATRRLVQVFGFQPETIRLTQQSMDLAHRAVMLQPDLKKLLDFKLRDAEGAFVSHSTSTAFLACGLTQHLEWASDFTRNKLSLAALLHDLFVDEEAYPFPQEMNELACDQKNSDPKVLAYAEHPVKAAKLLAGRSEFPPDVDHIIAQHHERPDGRGFPHRLSAARIHPLAALFIVCEDLVNFLGHRQDVEVGVQEFLILRADVYSSGNFRKVLQALAVALPSAEKGSLA
jgi:response regulator RpfG family c-di-GMP phosphodiesterase